MAAAAANPIATTLPAIPKSDFKLRASRIAAQRNSFPLAEIDIAEAAVLGCLRHGFLRLAPIASAIDLNAGCRSSGRKALRDA